MYPTEYRYIYSTVVMLMGVSFYAYIASTVSIVLSNVRFCIAATTQRITIPLPSTMRAEFIGHFEACMTEIYIHIDARMADYMVTHP